MHTALDGKPARAQLAAWPHDPDVLRIVLVDHRMVPTADDVGRWVAAARRRGAGALRTGALFPPAAAVFTSAGFVEIDRLALFGRHLGGDSLPTDHGDPATLRHLRPWHLTRAADLDRRAFGDPWGNDVASLEATRRATPTHRARGAFVRSRLVGVVICGRAGSTGYVQRLAVDPSVQRRGVGRHLVVDGLTWMARRGATTALVNTSEENDAAIGLYAGLGFDRRQETLSILEHRSAPRPHDRARDGER